MGGVVSSKDAEIIEVLDDGALGLTEEFCAKYENDMPDITIKRPVITRAMESLIKQNWENIQKGTNAYDPSKHSTTTKFFYETFYGILFAAAPAVRVIFRSSMNVQGRALGGMIGSLTSILQAENVVAATQQLARRHALYGAQKDHYTAVGSVLLQTLEIISGSSWTEDTKMAYLTAYSLLLYVMMPVVLEVKPTPMSTSVPGKIASRSGLGPLTTLISIELNQQLRFYPGDSIMLAIPDCTEGATLPLFRRYAITNIQKSAEGTRILDIIVKNVGKASNWLCTEENTTVDIYWIESKLKIEIDNPSQIPEKPVFLSSGIGFVPFVSLLRGLHSVRDDHQGKSVTFIHSSRTKSDLQFRGLIDEFADNWVDLTTHFILTKPEEGDDWTGNTGHIDKNKLLEFVPNISDSTLYISGTKEYVEDINNIVEELGIPKDKVFHYSFDNSAYNSHEVFLPGLK